MPTAHEVAPWVATIERRWDDSKLEARQRVLVITEARRWDMERVAEQYLIFFEIDPNRAVFKNGEFRVTPGDSAI